MPDLPISALNMIYCGLDVRRSKREAPDIIPPGCCHVGCYQGTHDPDRDLKAHYGLRDGCTR